MSAPAPPGAFSTTVGKKILMAVTGIVLFAFVCIHMVGNLQIYQGSEKLDHYARLLRAIPALLWGSRAILLGCALVHGFVGIQLWLLQRKARPVPYAGQDYQTATLASRSMALTGPLIALFVVYHVLNLTVGAWIPEFREGQVFANVVHAFSVVPAAAAYVLAMVALGFHLYHGAFSLFQTLGLRAPSFERPLKVVLAVISIGVVVVNITFPLAVMAGVVKDKAQNEARLEVPVRSH
jgi:succinate dehydrogenase / fumarate reductase, cytochrome b subunit